MPLLTDNLAFGKIHFQNKTYVPQTIQAHIEEVSLYLKKRTISNSPFVFLFAPNHVKTVYAVFGIIKAGKICVLVDPLQGKIEVEEMMKTTPPAAIIRINRETDGFDYNEEFEFKHYMLGDAKLQGLADVCMILYGAGMDGFPQAAMLTNESLIANANALNSCNELNRESTSCSIIAIHHLFAFQTGVLVPFLKQSNTLIVDTNDLRSMRSIATQLQDFNVDHIYSVPIVYYFLRKIPGISEYFKTVNALESGGCKLSRQIFDLYKADFGIEIHEGYGLTEASPMCTWHRPHDPIKIESVGRSLPGCEINIVDSDGKIAKMGDVGEVCVRGPNVFKGYFGNPSMTNDVFKNDFLFTGDLGKLDNDGYLYLKGIKKNMVNLGGNKVFPAETEKLIKKNNNVMSCDIKGVETNGMGIVVSAKIHLRNNTAESQIALKKWCRNTITSYKIPTEWVFI